MKSKTLKQSKFHRFRNRLGYVLHTHPALIIVCCLAICDVSLVVGQLICDLLIIREKLDQSDSNTQFLTTALKQRYPDDFECYVGAGLTDLIDHVNGPNGTTDHHIKKRDLVGHIQRSLRKDLPPQTYSDGERRDTERDNKGFSIEDQKKKVDQLRTNEYGAVDEMIAVQVIDVQNDSASCGNNSNHHDDHSHDLLHELTHAFHLASLTVLSIMLFEKILRLFAFGKYFFHSKLEIFDAFVVFVSWLLDLILIEGVWANTEVQAALLLVLLLPWRVIRIVNCFIMVFKEKYKIEIKILRSGKKQAEKKMSSLARQIIRYKSEIKALRGVCRKHGVDEETVGACHVKATESLRQTKISPASAILASTRMFMAAPLRQDPKAVDDLQDYGSDEESGSNTTSHCHDRGRSASVDSVTLGIYAQMDQGRNNSVNSLNGLDPTYKNISHYPNHAVEDYNKGRRDSFDGNIFWVDPESLNTQENNGNKNSTFYKDLCNI